MRSGAYVSSTAIKLSSLLSVVLAYILLDFKKTEKKRVRGDKEKFNNLLKACQANYG